MSCCNPQKKAHHSEEVKKSLQVRLKRIEGQLRGIRKMIEALGIRRLVLRAYFFYFKTVKLARSCEKHLQI